MPDKQIQNLTSTLDPLSKEDLFAVCDDPAGVPVVKKATALTVQKFTSTKGADVASATTTTLDDGEVFHITGTTTITDIDFTDSWNGRRALLIFDSILTLTHNATTLILPGGADITTAPGDCCWIVVDSGDNVKVCSYLRASNVPDVNPASTSTAAQSPAAGATTYLTGSAITVPPSKVKIGTIMRWRAIFTKTAAGTAASTFDIRVGTAGTTADTSRLSFAMPVGTAAVDTAYLEITVTVRGPLSASGVIAGMCIVTHNLATTGFINVNQVVLSVVSSAFDVTTANLIFGLSVTTGASVALTFQQVVAESANL